MLLPLACAPSGGGGGGGGAAAPAVTGGSGGAGTGPSGGSATNQTQWHTALAALAQAPQPEPLRLEPASVAVLNDAVARNWPHMVPLIRGVVEAELHKAIGQALGTLSIVSLRAIDLDLGAPPALAVSPPAPRQTVELRLPERPGAWALGATAEVGGTIPFAIFGFPSGAHIQVTLDIRVSNVRVAQPVDLDLSGRPRAVAVGAPALDLTLALSSQDPLVGPLTATLTQLLDPVVRLALVAGSVVAQRELGVVLGTIAGGPAWGLGGPGTQQLPSPPALEPIADAIATETETNHMPWGNVFPALFDQPDRGGKVVDWRHFGDSALWSGGFLAAESYRYDLTGDPRPLAAARRIVAAYDVMTRMASPGYGLLARCAVPLGTTPAAQFVGSTTAFTGVVDGVGYVASGDTSRDSYTGTTLGLGQAYHRIPPLRAEIAPIVARMIDYLEANDWAVYQGPGQPNNPGGVPGISVTCIQSPALMLAIATVGARTDAARHGALHARLAPLADLLWLNAWASSQEVHEGYFKFSLGHMSLLGLVELDADPTRYRGYLKLLGVLRDATAHHENPWFDSVAGTAVPSWGPAQGAQIQRALERWTLRPRRGFLRQLSLDPTIAKTTYTTSMPNATGAPSSGYQTGTRTIEVAVLPVPIEKRPPSAFIFSSSPFDLDGWEDPYIQNPGNDFLMPYWISRSHGLPVR